MRITVTTITNPINEVNRTSPPPGSRAARVPAASNRRSEAATAHQQQAGDEHKRRPGLGQGVGKRGRHDDKDYPRSGALTPFCSPNVNTARQHRWRTTDQVAMGQPSTGPAAGTASDVEGDVSPTSRAATGAADRVVVTLMSSGRNRKESSQ